MQIEKLIRLWLQPEENSSNFDTPEPYDIEPLDPQKRLRVLGGWLLEEVFRDINMFNHKIRVDAYLMQVSNMHKAYPIHERHINDIAVDMWSRYQYVYKTEILPAIKAYRRFRINADLKRMRFL